MKMNRLILPVIALVAAGIWLGSQFQSLSRLEKDINFIRKSIASRSAAAAVDDVSRAKLAASKQAKNDKPMDWGKLALALRQGYGESITDMRELANFRERLGQMTKEELVTALAEIAAIDPPSDSHRMLELAIVLSLIEQDPALAVTSLYNQPLDDRVVFSLMLRALPRWAGQDPAKAFAWFDQQIAAGKLESKALDEGGSLRTTLEATLFKGLFASDPNAAIRRLAAQPEGQRGELLMNSRLEPLKGPEQLAYAKMIRSQVPANEQANLFSKLASTVVADGGFAKVSEFLDRIQAGPAERATCAEEAAMAKLTQQASEKITPNDLDKMRTWVSGQAPLDTAKITGKILGNAMQGEHPIGFSEAAAMALQYNQASGNDDVLSSFLKSPGARENKDQARALAAKISEVKLREEILKTLD